MAFMRNSYSPEERDAYIVGVEAMLTAMKNGDIPEQKAEILKGMARRKVQQSEEEIDYIQRNLKFARQLVSRAVNKRNMAEIDKAYVDYAIVCSRQIKLDRIYTALGVTCREKLGFGRNRTLAFMHYFDDLCGRVSDDEAQWHDYYTKLLDDLGIVTQSGDIDLPKYLREFNPDDVDLHEETDTDKELGRKAI